MKVRSCSVQTTVLYLAKRRKVQPTSYLFRPERKISLSLMIWGCICYDGVGTLTAVEGNISSAKYIDILDKNLWPVVVWYFEGKENLFMDDNAPVHRAHSVENYKDQNEVTSIDGFHSDVIRLQSQKSEVLRILIYTRLKINKKQIFV